MKLSRPSFTSLKQHKRLMVVVFSVLVVVAGFTYVVWSKQQWDQYQPAYTTQQASIKTSIDKLAAASAVTDAEKKSIRESLQETSRLVGKTQATMCQVNPLMAWQESLVASLRKEREQCQQQAAKLGDFSIQLQKSVAFLQNDAAITKLFSGVAQPDEVADTAWGTQVTAWQATGAAIEKLTVSQDFKPVKQLAIQKVAAVATAWQGVVAAHEAKDKQKYLAAQAELSKAYDGLDEVAVKVTEDISTLASDTQESYQAAF
jgi:hypothetical protein